MRTKLKLLLLLLLATSAASAYDLRESVCVVRAEYSAEEKSKMSNFAIWFSRKGFAGESRTLTAYKNGAYGSGAVVEINGGRYVITNRHVVGYAGCVSVSFSLRDTTLLYEHCLVTTVDQQADLALVRLPKDCQQPPLSFATMQPEDGLDVVAAGFPGLGGKPSWQLTKGAISNAYLRVDEVTYSLIQHTAAIDPGSSGGPLLVQTPSGYQLIGVNTMKAYWRESVGIAIPLATLRTFVATIDTPSTIDHQLLMDLTIDGETWAKALDKMDKECLDSLRNIAVEMPLDVLTNTRQLACSPTIESMYGNSTSPRKGRVGTDHSSSVWAADYSDHYQIRAEYINGLGRNQRVTLAWEMTKSIALLGVHASAILDETETDATDAPRLLPGVALGIRFGLQFPLHMGPYYAVPRLTVSPAFAPLGFTKSELGKFSGMNAMIPFSAGNEFVFPVQDNYILSIGVHYVYDISLYNPDYGKLAPCITRQVLKTGNMVNVVGGHNLVFSFSFGW